MTLAGFLILLLLLSISFLIRHKDFKQVAGVPNLEATYHVILTINALKSSPIENHWLLPTVTLGKELDKNIPWGSTVPTKTGDYIYTSFTSPGFLAPYFVLGLSHSAPSEENLAGFNFVLGSIASFVLFALLIRILEYSGYNRPTAVAGAILGTAISVFSKEVLQSHGLVYWSQSLYQPILISGLYFLFLHLTSASATKCKKINYATYLIAAVFLGAWTEWTGYVFGVGLAMLFWFGAGIEQPEKELSFKLILAVVAAAILTLLHFGLVVGFEATIKAFVGRFLARNTTSGNPLRLLIGYWISFGFFILIACAAFVYVFLKQNNSQKGNSGPQKKLFFLIFAASIPLVENVIMLQHATQFSFDRLKFIFPAALIIAIAFSRLSNIWRIVLALSLVAASFQGYKSYKNDLSKHDAWAVVDINNKHLLNLISKEVNINCSVFLSNTGVRGYANSLLNRGMYEHRTKDDSITLIKQRKACSAIYLEGEFVYTDLPYYNKAWVTKPDGSAIRVVSK